MEQLCFLLVVMTGRLVIVKHLQFSITNKMFPGLK